MIRRISVVLVAAIALASGCASDDGEAVSSQRSTADTAAAPRLVLTVRDQGRTIRVDRTRPITLVLGGRFRWTDPTSGGAIRADELVSDAPSGAQMWELRVLRTGLATLRSRGAPACRPTAAGCPKTARRFVVRLDVRR